MKRNTNIIECEVTVSVKKAKNFIEELQPILKKYEIDVELNDNQDIILNVSHLIDTYYRLDGKHKTKSATKINVTTTERD